MITKALVVHEKCFLTCLLKRIDGKAAPGATPCSHQCWAVRQCRVEGQEEIEHLVKMEKCRKKAIRLMLVNTVDGIAELKRLVLVGIKMPAINKVPLLPVL